MPARLNTSTFIEKARAVHGDKYDYSLVEYTSAFNRVTIICPIHGEFQQQPNNHLQGKGCSRCADEYRGMNCRSNTEEFITKSRNIHGDLYDYSLVEYTKNNQEVKIICKEHGEFEQKPSSHLRGSGCRRCASLKGATASRSSNRKGALTQEQFLQKCREAHGDKYDYSKAVYINAHEKVTIICPEHGPFEKSARKHTDRGQGCLKCSRKALADSKKFSKGQFIERAQEVHGNKYDYSEVEYVNMQLPVDIICPEHGKFSVIADKHLRGLGTCKGCTDYNLLVGSNMVYFINLGDNLYKIGIASKYRSRLQTIKNDYKLPEDIEILYVFRYEFEEQARILEKYFLENIKSHPRYREYVNEHKPAGFTETFYWDCSREALLSLFNRWREDLSIPTETKIVDNCKPKEET